MASSEPGHRRGAVSRRVFLRRAALISGGLALAVACGPQAGGPGAPQTNAPAQGQPAAAQPQPAAASTGASKKGGVLRVGLYVEAATMDPHLSGSKIDRQIYHNVFEPLVVIDNKLEVKPNLAESWQTPDPKTLIFKLRQGVKFHDGTDFNAEAAKLNFDRMASEPRSVRKGEVANVGATATFTVVANGNPAPTYQWQKSGANISGATAATLIRLG